MNVFKKQIIKAEKHIHILADTFKTSNATLRVISFSSNDTVNTVLISGNTSPKRSMMFITLLLWELLN
jgi:hypothetical protein